MGRLSFSRNRSRSDPESVAVKVTRVQEIHICILDICMRRGDNDNDDLLIKERDKRVICHLARLAASFV